MTSSERSPHAWLAVVGGACLALATPPAAFPGAEWLSLPGLMAFYRIATASRRRHLHGWLFGLVHVLWFSWSLRHLVLGAYLAIGPIGGCYYLLVTDLTGRAAPRWRPLCFAVAVAAAFWLRAEMPEISYPHGQPCHCFWRWPGLLGAVTVGGEPLANLLLAFCAATCVESWQSWRRATPPWSAAWPRAACGFAIVAGISIAGRVIVSQTRSEAPTPPVHIVAIEPGCHPGAEWLLPREQRAPFVERQLRERWLAPTRRALAEAASPPDLVLWPESTLRDEVEERQILRVVLRLPEALPATSARLLVGAGIVGDNLRTGSSWLVELPSGRVLGHHDKQRLVPGGEFVPFTALLPDGLRQSVREWFWHALGTPPDNLPGTGGAPLTTATGVPFGALHCFDNAFAGPAADFVAAGARFLVVLSNESWYRGGAEVAQLAAMAVMRAMETATPVVRCTMDGWTMAIDARGRVTGDLPVEAAAAPEAVAADPAMAGRPARFLAVSVQPGPGRLPAMAWLRAYSGPAVGAICALLLAHGVVRWARLRAARTALPAAPASGLPE